jgi:4-hydroxy-tetrahydrodipicolinate reductase
MIRTMLRVLIAGATGWTGAPLARAVAAAPDLELAGGIARSGADFASVGDALAAVPADVLVDFTSAAAVRGHVDAALAGGLHVVVGSSGLNGGDFAEIDAAAHVGHREVVDYASAGKRDVPSGTARELAERLAEVRPPAPAEHDADLIGPPEARGADVAGTRVHSVRLAVLRPLDGRGAGHARRAARPAPRGRRVAGALRGRSAPRHPPGPGDHRVLRGLDRLLFG